MGKRKQDKARDEDEDDEENSDNVRKYLSHSSQGTNI